MNFTRNLICVAALLLAQSAARADCAGDIKNLTERRDALMVEIGPIPDPGEDTKLNPAAACPKLRELVTLLNQTVAWFDGHKTECGFPDAVVGSIAGQRDRVTTATASLCKATPKAVAPKKRAH